MAFTYTDDLTADRDKVRFWLHDIVEDQGPLPKNRNFSDNEVNGLLTIEATWQQAIAAGFETLASAWSKEGSFSVFNGSFTKSTAASYYMKEAKTWRKRHGDSDSTTAEIGFKDTDFSGNDVTPLFQREAFGHVVIDWDAE